MSKIRKTRDTCDYKILTNLKAIEKLRKSVYPTPVDIIFFNGTVPYTGELQSNFRAYQGTVYKDGNPVDLHHTSDNLVGILVGVVNYGQPGVRHAIGAVKRGKTLYACDSLGSERLKEISDPVFNQVAQHYGCTSVKRYEGENLQKTNSCVGFSTNFIAGAIRHFGTRGTAVVKMTPKMTPRDYSTYVKRFSLQTGRTFGYGNESRIQTSLKKNQGPRQTGVKGNSPSKVNTINTITNKMRALNIKNSTLKRKRSATPRS